MLEPSKTISDNTTICACGGTHHLYLSVEASLAHCDDCGEVLPVTAAAIASEDYVAIALDIGLVVSWPTFSAKGAEVADA